MIYKVLKFLIVIALKVFFRKRITTQKENLPKDGPLIILANHPGTFMDPFIIAATTKRKVYFLTKGSMFKNRFISWIFKQFNMIPVFRKQDNLSDMHKNNETFEKCYEHLENDGVILIFPEGVSITEKKLKPIKTGAARIALGAEARNNFELGVQIVPIGLNYDNPHSFREDVLINIGEAIDCRIYKHEYTTDAIAASKNLTIQIEKQLSDLIIDIKDKKVEQMVDAINEIYLHNASEDGIDDKLKGFEVTKNLAEIVAYFAANQKFRFLSLYSKIMSYLSDCESINIRDKDLVSEPDKSSKLKERLYLLIKFIFGLPMFIYGFIHHSFPYYNAPKIASKINSELEYKGPITMITGLFLFLIQYILFGFLFQQFFHNWIYTVVYLITLPLTGMFAYWYHEDILVLKHKLNLFSIFYNKKSMVFKLVKERAYILSEIKKAENEIPDSVKNYREF